MAKEAAVHRAGSFKQQNKPHKAGRHRVSSARRQGGRVPVKTLTRQVQRNWSKQDRRHRAWQLRRQHQQAVLEEKRNTY
ncbi:pre-rRNA-processing protein TSR1 homolog [Vipera latastei]